MNRLIVAATIASGLVATMATADAGWSRHKHYHATWHAPVAMRQVGPPWAGPNQCFSDLGYGRYETCDGGR
jgi:hypothetical protein